MPEATDRIAIANVVSPGRTYRVDRAKVEAMQSALLAVLPDGPPGLTPAEAQRALLPHLPAPLFPDGAKAGWWMKAAQLDLEAKRVIARAPRPPVRLYRLSEA